MKSGSATSSRLMVLLFTDVAGSVAIKAAIGTVAYGRMISRHDELFRQIIGSFAGAEIVKDTGDGFMARFANTSDAVNAALQFQHALGSEPWEAQPLKVRIGIHLGEVAELNDDVDGRPKIIGLAADFAARLMSLALPGQTLVTRVAFDEARQFVRVHPTVNGATPPELRWMAHGPYLFQGADEPMDVFEIGAKGMAPLQAPPNTEKVRSAVAAGEEEVLGWRPAAGLEIPGREQWVLERRLGEGGFGEVWLAEHHRTYAKRVYKFCFDAERLRSFKRELTLFRLLRDTLGDRPDIAQLHEIQLDSPPYFLESEFTESGNLADWAASQGGLDRIPIETRLDLVARTAEAVAAAHSIGVLHKDIKPSNILIYGEPGAPRPRLADFGIGMLADPSKITGRDITLSGFTETLSGTDDPSRTGTRMYAPPESLTGQPFTMQGDIYALGVLLYQMIVADLRRPLAHGWEGEIADPLLRDDIGHCVAGNPQDRFGSATDLAVNLRSLDQRRRVRRWQTFRQGAAAVGLISLVLLGIGVRVFSHERVLRREADQQRQHAESERQIAEAERTRADEARDKAQAASAKATAITDFLQNMLMSVDPNVIGGSREVTVREVLDAASGRLEAGVRGEDPSARILHDQPEIEAAIRSTIGTTYRSIGALESAEPHLTKAMDLRTAALGERNPETIQSTMDLGVLYRDQGKFDKAEPLLARGLELSREVRGPEDRQTLHAMTNLAELYTEQGRIAEAEQLNLQVYELSRRVMGEDHPDTLSTLNNLASSYRDRARFDEAEPLFVKLVDLSEKRLGPEHVETLTALNNYAMLLDAQGRPKDAEAIFARVLEVRKRVLGPDHPATLTSMNNLAAARSSLGELSEAKSLYAETYGLERRKLGLEHPDTLNALINLSFVEGNLGELEQAEAHLNEALPVAEKILGEKHPLTRGAMTNLAGVYQNQGKLDQAEQMYSKALELQRKYDGPEHPSTLSTMSDLAGIYRLQKNYAKSEPLWLEALKGDQKTLGPDHSQTLIVTNNIAALYRDMGRYDESLKMSATAIDGARRTLPKDHWYLGIFLVTQGKTQTRKADYQVAEASLKEAFGILNTAFGSDSGRTQDVVRALGDMYEAWQKPDVAATWRAKLKPAP